MESDRIFCSKCGAENKKSSKFCKKCGAALYYVSQPNKPSVAWYLLPIILGAVFLGWLGGIIGYIVLRVKDEKMAKNVLYVGIGTLVLGIILVILVAMVPSPPPVDTGVPISTPTPVAVMPTPTPTQYPWKSILIWEDRAPTGISRNILEVNVDLGRQLSSNEFKSLSEKVTLIDENGREYRSLGRSSGEGVTKSQSLFDSEGQVWVLSWSWHADFAYSFVFEVESESSSYTLSWPDYPPLEVGNPFQSVFCLGCIEEETPASTPVVTLTPTSPAEQERISSPRSLPTGTFIVKKLKGGDGDLTIENGLEWDAIAVLSKSNEPNIALMSVYIRSDDSYTITGIPDGVYILYYALGKDWDSSSKKFTITQVYKRFEEELEFETTRTRYTTFTAALYPVFGGTAETEPVDEANFPELS